MKLKKYITDERTGIGYTLCGYYYLPDLALPEQQYYDLERFGRAINAARANTTVVIRLASIPYAPPSHILLPTDCILKIAVTVSSFPLKLSPRIQYRMAFQKECKPQAAQIL